MTEEHKIVSPPPAENAPILASKGKTETCKRKYESQFTDFSTRTNVCELSKGGGLHNVDSYSNSCDEETHRTESHAEGAEEREKGDIRISSRM